jgi:hypothetical protein
MAPDIPPGSALATTTTPALSLQVNSVDDLARLARVFASSGLFGRGQNQDQLIAECAVRLMAGMEAGFSAFASATGVHIIEGKPAFSSNLLAQAVRRHPAYDYRVLEHTDKVCRIQFFAHGKPLGVSEWTMAMAERAGLSTKTNWRRYPEAQLFARTMSAGVRTHCPDALGGAVAYVPEELGGDEGEIVEATVTEAPAPAAAPAPAQPAPDPVDAAVAAAYRSGLTPEGLTVLVHELSKGEAQFPYQLPAKTLARLAKSGVSRETADRCNALAVATPVAEPAATDAPGLLEVDHEGHPLDLAPDDDPTDDPDDLPATWDLDD